MVGTDGEEMEETDGGVLDLIAIRCCLLVAHQCHRASSLPHCHVSWPCCCCPMLLSLCRVIGSLWSHSVSQQGGLGGRWDGGYLPGINNDKRWMSFVVLVAMSLLAMWHLHSPLAAGGRFHPWVAISTYGQLFAFMAVICVCGCCFWTFAFVASHLHSWPVVCIHRWSVLLYVVVGGGRCVVVVVGGIVWWSLWWLMAERKKVTHCDIRVMFKLTCEITRIISCDNYIVCIVNTPSPGPVLVQPQPR